MCTFTHTAPIAHSIQNYYLLLLLLVVLQKAHFIITSHEFSLARELKGKQERDRIIFNNFKINYSKFQMNVAFKKKTATWNFDIKLAHGT